MQSNIFLICVLSSLLFACKAKQTLQPASNTSLETTKHQGKEAQPTFQTYDEVSSIQEEPQMTQEEIDSKNDSEFGFGMQEMESSPDTNTEIYTFTEVLPEYETGIDTMFSDINKLLVKHQIRTKFPEISGTIFLQFVIEKSGRPSDVKILRGLKPELDAIIMQFPYQMRDWKPAKMRGETVRFYYNLPIKIKNN